MSVRVAIATGPEAARRGCIISCSQIQPLAAKNSENTSPMPEKMTRVCSVSKSFGFSERAGETVLELTAICDLHVYDATDGFHSHVGFP